MKVNSELLFNRRRVRNTQEMRRLAMEYQYLGLKALLERVKELLKGVR